MGINDDSDRADVNETDYTSLVVSVGTSEVEAKTTGGPLANRQLLTIKNDSNSSIFYGPTGVTTSGSTKGDELVKKGGFVSLPVGPSIGVFLIAGTASNDVIVQEFS